MKKISIFFDGTGKLGKDGGAENTNVFKLYEKVNQKRQVAIYIEGIGTDPRPMAKSFLGQIIASVKGNYDQILGVGASDRVRRAYLFLAKNYEKNDQVFLFGFSRGAFIARMLTGFIHRVGLLFATDATQSMIEHAFAMYCVDEVGNEFEDFVSRVEAIAGGRQEGILTHFLGQWDAVEALDVFNCTSDEEKLLLQAAVREHFDPLPPWIRNACHALALHEARQKFEPSLWSRVSNDTQELKQVWFAGAHADVGGGYASDDGAGSRYSDIALQWMWHEAKRAGLEVPEPEDWQATKNDDIPHIPELWKFGGMPSRVRSALESMARRGCDFEYLHDSVLSRLHTPIESSYDRTLNGVISVWRESDSISMHAHLAQLFDAVGSPPMSPQTLIYAEDLFFRFLTKETAPSKSDLQLSFKIILAFDLKPHLSDARGEIFHYDEDILQILSDVLMDVGKDIRLTSQQWGVVAERREVLNVWLENFIFQFACIKTPDNPYLISRKRSTI